MMCRFGFGDWHHPPMSHAAHLRHERHASSSSSTVWTEPNSPNDRSWAVPTTKGDVLTAHYSAGWLDTTQKISYLANFRP